jgi:hypothetical protein
MEEVRGKMEEFYDGRRLSEEGRCFMMEEGRVLRCKM